MNQDWFIGIAQSTLYKWIKKFNKEGKEGLKDKSKRPHKLFRLKVTEEQAQLILSIRKKYKYGQKRISAHLLRYHGLKLSSTTVWRILHKYGVAPVKKTRRSTKRKRYNRPVPGDRVQIDVTKIGSRCDQFTAIDDCTRLRVWRLYPQKGRIDLLLFWRKLPRLILLLYKWIRLDSSFKLIGEGCCLTIFFRKLLPIAASSSDQSNHVVRTWMGK